MEGCDWKVLPRGRKQIAHTWHTCRHKTNWQTRTNKHTLLHSLRGIDGFINLKEAGTQYVLKHSMRHSCNDGSDFRHFYMSTSICMCTGVELDTNKSTQDDTIQRHSQVLMLWGRSLEQRERTEHLTNATLAFAKPHPHWGFSFLGYIVTEPHRTQ